MESFFKYVNIYSSEIFIVLLCLFSLIAIVQWLTWIFSRGRFKNQDKSDQSNSKSERSDSLRYLFADLLVKIIDDFRHLLALIIVLIFAGILFYTLSYTMGIQGNENGNVEDISTVLQTVVASLGGIVGSIIGYYFGESVAQRRSDQFVGALGDAVQDIETDDTLIPAQTPHPSAEENEKNN